MKTQQNWKEDPFRRDVERFTLEVSEAINLLAATILSGDGSPESVIAAPVGTLYLRTDGGAGTTLWVKESGSGVSGWSSK